MSSSTAYCLWLPSWYPNKIDPFDGDFIQRHAQAVAMFKPVHVFFLVKDEKNKITNSVKVEERVDGNLTETIIYYSGGKFLFNFLSRANSFRLYRKLYRQQLEKLFQEQGLPSLVHVHIAFKAGLIADWVKKKYHIPYVLTEQWTIYLDEAIPNLNSISRINRSLISRVVSGASLLLPVSEYLGKAMHKRWPAIKQEVVPNVVNTTIFNLNEQTNSSNLKLVHISTLSYQKDPESLLQAAVILKRAGLAFTLEIFGPKKDEIVSFIKANGLDKEIILRGEVPQTELANSLQNCDALVLYSRYETFGCVLIEANACGKPVIVPDTSLMREIVGNNRNGILVKPQSAEALGNAIIEFARDKKKFDASAIAKETKEKYSFSKIGQQYATIYSRFTGN